MRIVLGCADGESGTVIAQRLGTTVQTVSKWRRRYQAYRLAGLTDAPRTGRPRSVGDERIQHIVDKVRHSRPDNATHWSVRQMSREAGRITGDGATHLACVWPEAAFAGDLQAVH
jgi:transposase